MKWALLFAALLLLRFLPCVTQSTVPAPPGAPLLPSGTNGSTCALWLYGTEPPQVKAFKCVRQPDGAEAKFCCGTCGQTRKCAFEELAPARPTDGGPEPCPPSIPLQQWERVSFFCGGVAASIIFFLAVYGIRRRYRRRNRSTRERQEGTELEVNSSERSRDSSDAPNTLAPPSSADAEGLQIPPGRPAAASSSAQGVQTQARGSENVTIMWYPTGFVPLRIGPTSPSKPIQGAQRPLAKSGK